MANVNPADSEGSRPVPDPTVLTTEALALAFTRVRELVEAGQELSASERHGLRDIFEKELQRLEEVHNQKFAGVDKQFAERDIRTSQADVARDSALQAALQAAKELVGAQGEATKEAAAKTETSFTKQIDQIGSLISNANTATNARVDELKERLDRGDGTHYGTDRQVQLQRNVVADRHGNTTMAFGYIGAAVGFLGLIVSILVVVTR